MTNLQKIILVVGALLFVILVAVYPVTFETRTKTGTGRGLFPEYTCQTRIDVGATALRGLAVAGATVAIYFVAGKRRP